MIESLKHTNLFKSLNLNKHLHHAYLFSSVDKELNNNIALLFANMLLCENSNICGECFACKQFCSSSHPDYFLINQNSIKVEDVNNLILKTTTKPIYRKHKVFVILNAENINEIAQNKLLKSLEEPNSSTIFILTTSKIDSLLPTILSRLHKITVPKLSDDDFKTINSELKQYKIDLKNHINNMNLTEILDFESNENFKLTINAIKYIFENLKSSQDIPKVAHSMPEVDKALFFPILQKLFLSCINNQTSYDEYVCELIKRNYPNQALINSLKLIEDAHSKLMANVNFSFILDNLLFNILKEKFLCNQSN